MTSPPRPDAATDAKRVAALKQHTATASVIASVVLTAGKAVAAVISGSLTLFAEALHGLIDIGATVASWFAIRVSNRPADDDHHFGHGKVESLAALVEAALLFGLAGGVGWEAVQRLMSNATPHVEVTPVVIGVLLAALLIDGTRWRTLKIVAKNTGSEALAGAAAHFGTDFVSTAAALIAMVAVMTGQPKADAIAAMLVACFAAISGFHLLRDTVATLTDKAPTGVSDRVRAAVEVVPGVSAIEWLRLRQSGGRLFGEVGVAVSRTLPLERAAEIKAEITRAIQQTEPFAEITITANPVEIDAETATETVMVTAARMRLPVHRVKVQRVGERLCVALDMEVAGHLPLQVAHDQASRLEDALRGAFGPGTEVDTHIEPLEPEDPDAAMASPEVHEQLRAALAAAAGSGPVSDVHSVRARQTGDGLVVVYHCRVDPALPVGEVHRAVDRMDRAIRTTWPQVSRIAGHAEPLR